MKLRPVLWRCLTSQGENVCAICKFCLSPPNYTKHAHKCCKLEELGGGQID
ncbi:unnamed protein product [Protopolystoma xenopodis]|uniref:Uncharacterized protein n=1 Tax=Protopolystoma xenopodis TaxID=117903 RepID=A0A448WX82_9PLAT|nr:unnamed protein product [Protopolystoma xenopodis]